MRQCPMLLSSISLESLNIRVVAWNWSGFDANGFLRCPTGQWESMVKWHVLQSVSTSEMDVDASFDGSLLQLMIIGSTAINVHSACLQGRLPANVQGASQASRESLSPTTRSKDDQRQLGATRRSAILLLKPAEGAVAL